MAGGSLPKFEVYAPQRIEGDIAAVGATGTEGTFLVYAAGAGFQYLDCSDKAGRWAVAAKFEADVAGALGLHVCAAGGEAAAVHVSYVDGDLRSWVCLQLPEAAGKAATAVARTAMPASILAARSAPGDAAAALALANGSVRFCDLLTGQTCGKGLKLEPRRPDAALALARLGPGRAALVRQGEGECEFFVVALDGEAQRATLERRGVLGGSHRGPPSRVLVDVANAALASAPDQDRVLLCWKSPDGEGSSDLAFAAAALHDEVAELVPLLTTEKGAGPVPLSWLCVMDYLVEWSPRPDSAGKDLLSMRLRDTRFGVAVASGEVPFAAAGGGSGGALVATAGRTTVLLGRKGGTGIAAVRWLLPGFSLGGVIGSGAAEPAEPCKLLAPLHGVLSGKRPRDDPGAQELFSAKRRAATDEAIAVELRRRRWKPSHKLVDTIVQHQCWAAAGALLSLPELDEHLAIRLLSARVELLPYIVRRARTPQQLELALRDHLPASLLPAILEVLLEWLEAYRDCPEAAVQKAAPGLPRAVEVVGFLRALADGCLPSLAALDEGLIERVVESLNSIHVDLARTERLCSTVRAACWMTKPFHALSDAAPAVEVLQLHF
eukprot:CAMPEP_0179320210 /NCGR_PEP_ID=MMETSP0797-20121207/57923_1 /TAXON_ID=47934 /ORGANISM="Dinophysis acuminata, Strain DAEP01" /LENGTH=607 /DNA_ID=CAMNT_0021031685 /DNA_START=21 /DNA_END=1844 /DNA_ORIENTATION=-